MDIEESVKENYKTIGELLKLQGLDGDKLNLINSLYNLKDNISSKKVTSEGLKIVFHNWFIRRIIYEKDFINYLNKNGANLGERKEKYLLQPRYENCLINNLDNDFYLVEIISNNKEWIGGFDFAFHNPKPKTINL